MLDSLHITTNIPSPPQRPGAAVFCPCFSGKGIFQRINRAEDRDKQPPDISVLKGKLLPEKVGDSERRKELYDILP
ncbi:MAG: hypothetical protein QNJ46_01605 [Leptolyngbyaceae cyanobacterium MO_188.B28]|nr:hypothetical protein [Leptolyngbyaceae cyanobacterium MO_188.B28]